VALGLQGSQKKKKQMGVPNGHSDFAIITPHCNIISGNGVLNRYVICSRNARQAIILYDGLEEG
jgi:hypothetical protein